MNVCVWSDTSFEREYASFHLLKDIILQLLKKNNHVWLVQVQYSDGTVPNEFGKYSNLHIVNVKQKPTKKSNFFLRYLSTLSYFYESSKKVKEIVDLDVIFLQSTNAPFFPVHFSKIKKIPIVFNVQDIFPQNALYSGLLTKGIIYRCLYQIQKYAYKNSTNIITISDDMKEEIANMGVPKEKINVIYNWSYQDTVYDIETLDYSTVDSMFNNEKFNVVYAGNIGTMQNVDILINAASIMKDDDSVWFHIIGDGVYKEKLVKRSEELKLTNISFWGMQPSSLAPAIYAHANVNVIPLMKDVYKTALPSKTATCLAVQRPIIFCIGKDSHFGKLVEHTTGCPVIDSDNAEALKKAIEDIKKDIIKCDTETMFNTYFRREQNSLAYTSIIIDVGNEKVQND